jgi:hypothetical protein
MYQPLVASAGGSFHPSACQRLSTPGMASPSWPVASVSLIDLGLLNRQSYTTSAEGRRGPHSWARGAIVRGARGQRWPSSISRALRSSSSARARTSSSTSGSVTVRANSRIRRASLRSSAAVFTGRAAGDTPESDQVWVSRRPLASSSSAKSRHRFARYSNISRVSGFVAVSASRSHSFARAQHSWGGV